MVVGTTIVLSRQLSVVRHMHKFRKLMVWQKSMEFITKVYKVTTKYPKYELYGLIDQIRRAAVAIALNIAEGSGSGSDKEFCRFLRISLRSMYEVITGVEIAIRLHYGEEQENNNLIQDADEIGAMLSGLIKSLKTES